MEAESLGSILKERNPNFPIDIHHGSLAKELRENTEHMLRTSEAKIVVCTSSLELGIDIGSVDLVIQFGSPRQAIKLIQRIGRSRHQIGKTARGMIVSNKEDDILEAQALMQRVEEHDLEDIDFHENSLDVIANHIAAMMLQNYSMNILKLTIYLFTIYIPWTTTNFQIFWAIPYIQYKAFSILEHLSLSMFFEKENFRLLWFYSS